VNEFAFDFNFGDGMFKNEWVDLTGGLVAHSHTPVPVEERGVFFDGDDCLTLDPIQFNYQFTLNIWVLNQLTDWPQTIFSVSRPYANKDGAEEILSFKRLPDNTLEI
jgi:hypothetical protein